MDVDRIPTAVATGGRLGVRAAVLIGGLAVAGIGGLCSTAEAKGCRLVPSTDAPSRQILRCSDGPLIEAEDRADVHVQDPQGLGHPTGVTIGTGAVLLDVPPGYPGGFQILAPRAIASVRGTAWIVDVQQKDTAVFVLRGRVEVQRSSGSPTIALGARQGVDVLDDGLPLKATRWPRERAAALLSRFGR